MDEPQNPVLSASCQTRRARYHMARLHKEPLNQTDPETAGGRGCEARAGRGVTAAGCGAPGWREGEALTRWHTAKCWPLPVTLGS